MPQTHPSSTDGYPSGISGSITFPTFQLDVLGYLDTLWYRKRTQMALQVNIQPKQVWNMEIGSTVVTLRQIASLSGMWSFHKRRGRMRRRRNLRIRYKRESVDAQRSCNDRFCQLRLDDHNVNLVVATFLERNWLLRLSFRPGAATQNASFSSSFRLFLNK